MDRFDDFTIYLFNYRPRGVKPLRLVNIRFGEAPLVENDWLVKYSNKSTGLVTEK